MIIGGGFGGLKAAEALARLPVQITLVDRKNHHTFQPLLYQVATAGLSPAEIAAPIREILARHENVEVLLGEVVNFDLQNNTSSNCMASSSRMTIWWSRQEPATPTSDTMNGRLWLPASRPSKTRWRFAVASCLRLKWRNVMLPPPDNTAADLCRRRRRAHRRGAWPAHWPKLRAGHCLTISAILTRKKTRIILLEAGPVRARHYPDDLRESAKRQLERLGVDVRLNSAVTDVRSGRNSRWQRHRSCHPRALGGRCVRVSLGPRPGRSQWISAGRVMVEADLSLPGHPEVFVIGDLASLKQAEGTQLPGVAPVAMQEGKWVARQIAADLAGNPRAPFHYDRQRKSGHDWPRRRGSAVRQSAYFRAFSPGCPGCSSIFSSSSASAIASS